jgi:hypothetical protein
MINPRGRWLAAALVAAATGALAAGAAQASTTYTFDFLRGDPNLSYVGVGDVSAQYDGGALVIGKPKGGDRQQFGYEGTTFSVSGDFTARVTVDASGLNPVCNICGNQVQAFLGVGTGSHGDFVGTIADENGIPAETVFDSSFLYQGFLPTPYWQFSRSGDVLTASFLNSGLQVLATRTVSGADYLGPAVFFLSYGDYTGNTSAGSIAYRDFVITADQFNGLVLPGSPTPEPGAWSLMIAGFGLLGATLRRRIWRPLAARA